MLVLGQLWLCGKHHTSIVRYDNVQAVALHTYYEGHIVVPRV